LHDAFAVVLPYVPPASSPSNATTAGSTSDDPSLSPTNEAESGSSEAGVPPAMSYLTLDFSKFGGEYASGHGHTYALNLHRLIIGKGSIAEGPVVPRFKDPDAAENNAWMPASVPRVKPQEWKFNYLDGNIADNPPHPALPDKLIGPSYIAEWRRAKYVAVSKLTPDFLDTTGETRTYEGGLEKEQDLIFLRTTLGQFGQLSSFDQLRWETTPQVRPDGFTRASAMMEMQELGPGQVNTTQPLRIYGDMEPFLFITASDWYDRFHQYRRKTNERSRDPVNFKNELTDGHS